MIHGYGQCCHGCYSMVMATVATSVMVMANVAKGVMVMANVATGVMVMATIFGMVNCCGIML